MSDVVGVTKVISSTTTCGTHTHIQRYPYPSVRVRVLCGCGCGLVLGDPWVTRDVHYSAEGGDEGDICMSFTELARSSCRDS
jgi:hypothetical protein